MAADGLATLQLVGERLQDAGGGWNEAPVKIDNAQKSL
jgi:hypothetical protein